MVRISNGKQSAWKRVWFVRILAAVLLVWGIALFMGMNNSGSTRDSSSSWSLSSNQLGTPVMPLTQHKLVILKDNELAFMLPTTTTPAVGLLLFFHGCTHSAEDLFLLPEDRIVAVEALEKGLAVLAITSHDRETGCWSNKDVAQLQQTKVVDFWMKQQGLSPKLPRVGMGASSGGAMAVWASKALNFKAIASYIMATENDSGLPTAYIHMPVRDPNTAARVKQQVQVLKTAGIETLELTCKPHPLTENVCNQRLAELGKDKCHKLISSATTKGLLDKDGNVLKPSTLDWTSVLVGELQLDAILAQQQNPDIDFYGHSRLRAAVQEEIAVAYGRHEMTAEHVSTVLHFLMTNAGI